MTKDNRSLYSKDFKHARKVHVQSCVLSLEIALKFAKELEGVYSYALADQVHKRICRALDQLSQAGAYANMQYTAQRNPDGNND